MPRTVRGLLGRVLGAVTLILAPGTTSACWQGYETPEELLARASFVLEVEVVGVRDAEPAPERRSDPDDPPGRRARADVQVLQEVLGTFPARRFELVGGPYDS